MGASERELMWQIMLPAALPQILTGLQVALPLSLIVAVVAEMAMGGYGLGGAMMTASRFADSRGVFAGIVEIAAVGFCLIKVMALLRRRLLLWHQEALEPTHGVTCRRPCRSCLLCPQDAGQIARSGSRRKDCDRSGRMTCAR